MGKKEFKRSFIEMNQKQLNEGNLFQKSKEGNTEEYNKQIDELERTADEFKIQVNETIYKMSNLPITVIDDHFRVGLHVIFALDGKKPTPHLFFAIYGGKVSKKRIVLKNVFIGNTYICDHCFTDINNNDIGDIQVGDVVVVTAGIDFYGKNNNNTFNYGLILMDNITKYGVEFDKVIQPIKYVDNINVMITKVRELVTFHSINAALPIYFIDNLIVSTLTCKQKEFELMKGSKLEEIIPKELNDLVLQAYSLVLSLINDNIYDFIFIQRCLVELILHAGVSLYEYTNYFNCTQEDIKDTLELYYNEYNKVKYKLTDEQLQTVINNGFKFVKSLFH